MVLTCQLGYIQRVIPNRHYCLQKKQWCDIQHHACRLNTPPAKLEQNQLGNTRNASINHSVTAFAGYYLHTHTMSGPNTHQLPSASRAVSHTGTADQIPLLRGVCPDNSEVTRGCCCWVDRPQISPASLHTIAT